MARQESRIFGINPVTSLLEGDKAGDVREIWLQDRRKDRRTEHLRQLARKAGCRVHSVDREALDELVPGQRHQGVVASFLGQAPLSEADLMALVEQHGRDTLLLVLDEVQDPHNLGACLRSADGAGVQAVIVPKDRSAGLTPVVRKVASGAAESVPLIQVTNLARSLQQLAAQGVFLMGLAGEAEQSLYQADLTGPVALVLGSEGKGLRRLTRERCDQLLKLPMAGQVDSLNVSVTTGICLYEVVRQRSLSA